MEGFKTMMKVLGILLAALAVVVALAAIVLLTARAVNAGKYRIESETGIDETGYVEGNGIRQFVHIRGENTANPVMIFLHGGPGSPMGFAAPYYQRPIEQQFTVIQYDQRGCGRTYYANAQNGTPTVAQMVDDLDALVDDVRERFGQEKVVIMGHSWGTILGMLYAREHAEKISAYIGVSQAVGNLYDGKILLGEKALTAAQEQGHAADAQKLAEALRRMYQVRTYDAIDLNDLMTVSSLSAKYLSCEGEMSSMGQIWTGITSPYMNATDVRWFMKMGSDTESFFASQGELMPYAFFGFDLYAMGNEYEFPVYFISGSNDDAIPQEQTRAYFDGMSAPDKAFITLDNTGHSPFMDAPNAFADAVLSCFA